MSCMHGSKVEKLCDATPLDRSQSNARARLPFEGDCDSDGDRDISDVACFFDCVTGPAGSAVGSCAVFDFDEDDDVDFVDWSLLQLAFTGPNG